MPEQRAFSTYRHTLHITAGPVSLPQMSLFRDSLLNLAKRRKFEEALTIIQQQAGPFRLTLEPDDLGQTAAHFAAMSPEGYNLLSGLKSVFGYSCLELEDLKLATPLQYATSNYPLQQLTQLWPNFIRELCSYRRRDKYGNTLAHYAAKNSQHEEVILQVVNKEQQSVGGRCLMWINDKKQTVLHVAMQHCHVETAKILLNYAHSSGNFDPEKLTDEDGDTLAHSAARNQRSTIQSDNFFDAVAFASWGPKCLEWKNARGESVLHTVVKYCSDSTVGTCRLVDEASIDFKTTDEAGNTILHYAGLYKKPKMFKRLAQRVCSTSKEELAKILGNAANSDGQIPLHFSAMDKSTMDFLRKELSATECYSSVLDNYGRNMLFYACVGWNFEILLSKVKSTDDYLVRDVEGNTLLHALMLGNGGSSPDFKGLCAVAEKLIGDFRIDPKAENLLGQNWLQSSDLDESILKEIFFFESKSMKQWMKSLAYNSRGFHILHFFSGRYLLENLIGPIEKLLNTSRQKLLRRQVLSGPRKSATCLHFACQAGHTRNISFLINEGLRLMDSDQAGLTCVDYALQAGELDSLFEALSIHPVVALRLTDPVRRSLRLPDRESACQALSFAVDGTPLGQEEAPRVLSSMLSVKSVYKAWEADSRVLFRSLLRLNLLNRKSEAEFVRYLTGNSANPTEYDISSCDNWLRDAQGIKPPSELLIIDLAFQSNKMELLPDLIVTRQFDLIPACLRLLIQLQNKLAGTQDRQGQLNDLYNSVKSISISTINQLYNRADLKERHRLFSYILGEIYEDKLRAGPMFPVANWAGQMGQKALRGKDEVNGVTIIELIEQADCHEIFATDCLYELTENEWRASNCFGSRGRGPSSIVSPLVSFHAHLSAHITFLIYFSWYSTDFSRTFQNGWIDAILTAFASLFLIWEVIGVFAAVLPKVCFNGRTNARPRRATAYFRDFSNLICWCALILLWLGIIWKWCIFSKPSDVTVYACQAVMATSCLMWGLRLIAFMNFSGRLGPMLTMIKSVIIQDFLPFAAIISVVLASFGVFFFNVLFPVSTSASSELSAPGYWWRVILQIFTLPLDLLFTNFDRMAFETPRNGLSQSVGSVANAIGLSWFRNILLFAFLGLVNIVLLYMLIARFTYRVIEIHSRAIGLWRRSYFQMLREYQGRVSLVTYWACCCCCCRNAKIDCSDSSWWQDERNYPLEYLKYLDFQAEQLRILRPQLAVLLEQLQPRQTGFELEQGSSHEQPETLPPQLAGSRPQQHTNKQQNNRQ